MTYVPRNPFKPDTAPIAGPVKLNDEELEKLESVLTELGLTPWARGYNEIRDEAEIVHYENGDVDIVVHVKAAGRKPNISKAARRLCQEHNNRSDIVSGDIYSVDLATGHIIEWVAGYSATQPELAWRKQNMIALMRISHGKITQEYAEEFIANWGERA